MSTVVLRKATKVETESTPMSRLKSMVGVRVMGGMISMNAGCEGYLYEWRQATVWGSARVEVRTFPCKPHANLFWILGLRPAVHPLALRNRPLLPEDVELIDHLDVLDDVDDLREERKGGPEMRQLGAGEGFGQGRNYMTSTTGIGNRWENVDVSIGHY